MEKKPLSLQVNDQDSRGAVSVSCAAWPSLRLAGLLPALRMDGTDLVPLNCAVYRAGNGSILSLAYAFAGNVCLTVEVEPWLDAGWRLRPALCIPAGAGMVLNDVCLLGAASEAAAFGADSAKVRLLEQQGNCGGRTRWLAEPLCEQAAAKPGEPNEAPTNSKGSADLVWVAYDRQSRHGLLVGFLTSERWRGQVETESTPAGQITRWRIGFDGADVLLAAGTTVTLEELVLLAADDPWALLEAYGDAVRVRHQPGFPATPPVSWCSWYPYRLGVTEERVLENARIAAERLKPLGFSIVEVDLGWEEGNLPSTFTENERFPHGLTWLAEQLREFGFDLGVWKAPYTISEFDPLVKAHPEYLVQGEDGKPAAYWEWFWEPHGKVFILDLTHPGAQQWLRDKVASLAARGVRYLKNDFISCVFHPLARQRHDRHIAAGNGMEAARLGAGIIREAMGSDALILNCGGPEMPGSGHWPLLYTCNDTGNTGFVSHVFQQSNYEALACHLWKNHRWGILQPSCLCVGGPGTLEDARLRATLAFLSGGQIDISDTLTTLPEDRWAVLTATLPPLGLTAKPVDLFEPLSNLPFDYAGTCKGEKATDVQRRELPPGSVWHLHVRTDWDEWDLVGLFSYNPGSSAASPEVTRFAVPFARLGIAESATRWGYEFWSGQFLGTLPGKRVNACGYVHPGDYQDLSLGDAPGVLDIAFFGPGAKLLCLRSPRPHPWVIGSTFHQSCGTELRNVVWDAASATLSGEVHRPAGANGAVVIAAAGAVPRKETVNGKKTFLRTGANGSLLLPVTVQETPARWAVRFTGV